MRRWLIASLALLYLGFIGCGGKKEPQAPTTNNKEFNESLELAKKKFGDAIAACQNDPGVNQQVALALASCRAPAGSAPIPTQLGATLANAANSCRAALLNAMLQINTALGMKDPANPNQLALQNPTYTKYRDHLIVWTVSQVGTNFGSKLNASDSEEKCVQKVLAADFLANSNTIFAGLPTQPGDQFAVSQALTPLATGNGLATRPAIASALPPPAIPGAPGFVPNPVFSSQVLSVDQLRAAGSYIFGRGW